KAFWQKHHWYDEGGYLPPGISTVVDGTGKPEPVFTAKQWDVLKGNVGEGAGASEVHNHFTFAKTDLTPAALAHAMNVQAARQRIGRPSEAMALIVSGGTPPPSIGGGGGGASARVVAVVSWFGPDGTEFKFDQRSLILNPGATGLGA